MGVFNRRNAAIGWVTWAVGKRVLKRKAKGAAPSIDPVSGKPNKSAIALAVAGVVGALGLAKKKHGGGNDAPPADDASA